jgi:hypothetical protein
VCQLAYDSSGFDRHLPLDRQVTNDPIVHRCKRISFNDNIVYIDSERKGKTPKEMNQPERVTYFRNRSPKFDRQIELLEIRGVDFRVSSGGVIYNKISVLKAEVEHRLRKDRDKERANRRRRKYDPDRVMSEMGFVDSFLSSDTYSDGLSAVVDFAMKRKMALILLMLSISQAESPAEIFRIVAPSAFAFGGWQTILGMNVKSEASFDTTPERSFLSTKKLGVCLGIVSVLLGWPHLFPMDQLMNYIMDISGLPSEFASLKMFKIIINEALTLGSRVGLKSAITRIVQFTSSPLDASTQEFLELKALPKMTSFGSVLLGEGIPPNALTFADYCARLDELKYKVSTLSTHCYDRGMKAKIGELIGQIDQAMIPTLAEAPIPMLFFVTGPPNSGKTQFCAWAMQLLEEFSGVQLRQAPMDMASEFQDRILSLEANVIVIDDANPTTFSNDTPGFTWAGLQSLASPYNVGMPAADPKMKKKVPSDIMAMFVRTNFNLKDMARSAAVEWGSIARRVDEIYVKLEDYSPDKHGDDPADILYSRWKISIRKYRNNINDAFDHEDVPIERFPDFIKRRVHVMRNEYIRRMSVRQQSLCPLCKFPGMQCACTVSSQAAYRYNVMNHVSSYVCDLSLATTRQSMYDIYHRVMYGVLTGGCYLYIVFAGLFKRDVSYIRSNFEYMDMLRGVGVTNEFMWKFLYYVSGTLAIFSTVYGITKLIQFLVNSNITSEGVAASKIDPIVDPKAPMKLEHISILSPWGENNEPYDMVAWSQPKYAMDLRIAISLQFTVVRKTQYGEMSVQGVMLNYELGAIPQHFFNKNMDEAFEFVITFCYDTVVKRKYIIHYTRPLLVYEDPVDDVVVLHMRIPVIHEVPLADPELGEEVFKYDPLTKGLVSVGIYTPPKLIKVEHILYRGILVSRSCIPYKEHGPRKCGLLVFNKCGRVLGWHIAGDKTGKGYFSLFARKLPKYKPGFVLGLLNVKGTMKPIGNLYEASSMNNVKDVCSKMTVLGTLAVPNKQKDIMVRTSVVCTDPRYTFYPPILQGKVVNGAWSAVEIEAVSKCDPGIIRDSSEITEILKERYVPWFKDYFAKRDPTLKNPLRLLSVMESFHGIFAEDNDGIKIPKVARRTAMGTDYVGVKADYLDNPARMAQVVKDVNRFYNSLKPGMQMNHVNNIVGKADAVDAEDKTARGIFINPLVILIVLRMYLEGFTELWKTIPGVAVGVNCFDSDIWCELNGRVLDSNPDNIFAANMDCSKFDKSMSLMVIRAILLFIYFILATFGSFTERELEVFLVLIDYIDNLPVLAHGELLTPVAHNTSGSAITTLLNSLASEAMVSLAHKVVWFVLPPIGTFAVYGDDARIMRRSLQETQAWLDAALITYRKYGFKPVNAANKKLPPSVTTLKQTDFLKRGIYYHADLDAYTPPLALESVFKQVLWHNKQRADWEQAVPNSIKCSKMELALWGREVYDRESAKFPAFAEHQFSYDDCIALFKQGRYETELMWW